MSSSVTKHPPHLHSINDKPHSPEQMIEQLKRFSLGKCVLVQNESNPFQFFAILSDILTNADRQYAEGNIEEAYVLYLKYLNLSTLRVKVARKNHNNKPRYHPRVIKSSDRIKEEVRASNNVQCNRVKRMLPLLTEELHQYYKRVIKLLERDKRADKVASKQLSGCSAVPSTLDYALFIKIPTQLPVVFQILARSNTVKNIETLGILAGNQHGYCHLVTHLIVPYQTGFHDRATYNQSEVLKHALKTNLDILGWIHIHPEDKPYMGSLDLHVQHSFQTVVPEAVGIVCSSPRYCLTNVYHLTASGMRTIGQCSRTGLHPHGSENLYEEAKNVIYEVGLPLTLQDFTDKNQTSMHI